MPATWPRPGITLGAEPARTMPQTRLETVVLRSKTGTVRRIKTTFRMIGTKANPGI